MKSVKDFRFTRLFSLFILLLLNKTLPELDVDAWKENKNIKEYLESIMGDTGNASLSWL